MQPGLEGVPIAESKISLVDGEAGWLGYRGYPIGELADGTFEETVALLYDGELPSAARLDAVGDELRRVRSLTDEQIAIARQVAAITHPMFALQAAVATLGPRTNDFDQQDFEAAQRRGMALIGKVGHLVGTIAQAAAGRPYEAPQPGDSHARMLLRMITGREPSEWHEQTMNTLLILQADHSAGNASTFTTRVVTSTRAEPEPVISAAIASLSGPAHGGANEAAIRLFERIGSPESAPEQVERMLDAKERIPGFGHRIYHVKDPRSIVIQRLAEEVIVRPEDRALYDIALIVERIASDRLSERGLWPNVDLFSGCVFRALDVPIDFFTPLFAAARTAGWCVHLKEQMESGNRLFRPRQIWMGPDAREYVPLDRR
jgi:citrate synthase